MCSLNFLKDSLLPVKGGNSLLLGFCTITCEMFEI